MSHTTFLNFTVAENKKAGFEFFRTDGRLVKVIDSAVIGMTTGNPGGSYLSGSAGIRTPKTNNFLITNVRFSSFTSSQVAIILCNGCGSPNTFVSLPI